MKKILMIVAGGGFFYESVSLVSKLNSDSSISVAIPSDSWGLAAKLENIFGERFIFFKIPPVIGFSFSILGRITNFFRCMLSSISIFRENKPDVIIAVGTSIAVPVFFIAKLFKIKTIFVESITRVDRPSKTCLILSSYRLANRLYVQWPEAAYLCPRAVYKGTVL